MSPLHAVAVLLLDASGHTWLARRRRAPCEGLWECPGGAVEAGELPDEAAVREVWEETGLAVQGDSPLLPRGVVPFTVEGREVWCNLFVWHTDERPRHVEPDARMAWWRLATHEMELRLCTPATGALLALAPWAPRE
jgi:8-oxo-dGTP pyrophosphatase MutT (NUDIX family)